MFDTVAANDLGCLFKLLDEVRVVHASILSIS
jgi:hypothetical protein